MIRRSVLALAAALAFVAAVPAHAAGGGAVNVDVNSDTTLAGKQIAQGRYKIEWQGEGDATKVIFSRNGKVVAEAPARLEERPNAAPFHAVVSRPGTAGAKQVSEVWLKGKKSVIVVPAS